MSISKALSKSITYIFLTIALIVFVFPFYLLIINSFKSNGEILVSPFSFPKSFSLNHFFQVLSTMDFTTTFTNSLFITVGAIVLISITSAMCAYYLVRVNSILNNGFFALLVASMIIPFQSVMIPIIVIYGAKLNMIENMPRILLIVLYSGFGSMLTVFFYHGFIKSIPLELEEAALIDGCNRITTFFKIVFPMLGPTTMTVAILNTMWIWNDYLLPSLVLTKMPDFTMPIKMRVFFGQYAMNWELIIPTILITLLPILVVYFVAQRKIIEGVMAGSIK